MVVHGRDPAYLTCGVLRNISAQQIHDTHSEISSNASLSAASWGKRKALRDCTTSSVLCVL